MDFDEFRISIQPDLRRRGRWSVQVRDCPETPLIGCSSSLRPRVKREHLQTLRNSTAPPDLLQLKRLGQQVLDTIMSETIAMGLHISAWRAEMAGRGLRLVVSMIGDSRPSSELSLHELPIEAAFHKHLDFLATNERTPISRSTGSLPNREPARVALPIRILVVASEPDGMAAVDAAAEQEAIQRALAGMIESGAVVVNSCIPPTLDQLRIKLQEEVYHVVHFIGHGDFEIAGMDPNPQPHLYFEDGTARRFRRAVDAEQLYGVLSSGRVPLVVLSACSTAAASPNGEQYPVMAFESLAQALMERQWGPSGVIAMQFDFHSEAATIFSHALYEKLVRNRWCLDAAVASARSALASHFGAGHRAWVTPIVYWRCKGGRLFEFLTVESQLNDQQRARLLAIDAQVAEIFNEIDSLVNQPPAIRSALGGRLRLQQNRLRELNEEHGNILGTTLRLLGGTPGEDGIVDCHLVLQLRAPARIGEVDVVVLHSLSEFLLIDTTDGQNVARGSVFARSDDNGNTRILIRRASSGGEWPKGLYRLARLRIRPIDPSGKPIFQIRLSGSLVEMDDVNQPIKALNAVIWTESHSV